MELIVCVDDNGGLAFNHRRQSRDSVLINDIIGLAADKNLVITPYSEPLFTDHAGKYSVSDDLSGISDGSMIFAENTDVTGLAAKADAVTVYRWNRVYPADLYIGGSLDGFRLDDVFEFVGSSHEKISRERWVK